MLGRRITGGGWLLAASILAALALVGASCGGDGVDAGRTPTAAGGAVLLISPGHGQPDNAILVSGCGFTPNGEVTISATILGSVPKALADASGRFRFNTVVPSLGSGTYVVRASSSESVYAETVFVIEQQIGDASKSPAVSPTPATAEC